MRLQLRSVLMCAVPCAGVLAFAPAAQAQSLFQKLLGLGSNPAQQPPAAQIPARRLPSVRFQNRGLRRWHSIPRTAEEEIGPPDSGGPYRTMCVRACDGYYFPIRHNARRRNFASDVKSCRNACGDEARLFYFPENGGSADTMTDLAGRPYAERPNAFAYRKALVSSCTCKPAPWSREEAARHQSYAAAEDAQVAAAQTEPANQTAMPQPPEDVSGQLEPSAALPERESVQANDESISYALAATPMSYRIMKPAPRAKRAARRKARAHYARMPRALYPRYYTAPKKSTSWLSD
jgi:hypothetical protein